MTTDPPTTELPVAGAPVAVLTAGGHDLCTPLGFTRSAPEGAAGLSWQGDRWAVGDRPLDAPLGAGEVAALRPLRALHVGWPEEPSGDAMTTIVDLAGAGVPLTSGPAPSWVRDADPRLADLVAGWAPELDGEMPAKPGSPAAAVSVADLRREEHSVRLRRHALRAKGLARVLPSVTVVMATRRPHFLRGALEQMAAQRHVDLQVIVALHGVPLAEVREAVEGLPLPLTVLEEDARAPFGEVLNRAAARAEGDVLAKWDDDDWYGPEHLADLLLARAYSGGDVVGMAQEFFYLEPLNVTIRRVDYSSEVWSDHVAGGTVLIGRELFHEVGGFGPNGPGEDAHLLRAVGAAGGSIYRTHGLGYVLRRSVGAEHTWQLPLAHFLRVAAHQWRGFRPSSILEGARHSGGTRVILEGS
ncbi:glycosyltransferase family 2 protein [Microbispora sp. NPDC049125]|uniref:glycosyltransferase family 2 protein n=1 Tax=Microbispora sp. NPDC049125 TaxID=3154929 RepID=UPI0034675951